MAKQSTKNEETKDDKRSKIQKTVEGDDEEIVVKPPRAKSAYNYYMVDQQKVIRTENPDVENTKIMGMVSEKWKHESEEKKNHYEELAKKDAERKQR